MFDKIKIGFLLILIFVSCSKYIKKNENKEMNDIFSNLFFDMKKNPMDYNDSSNYAVTEEYPLGRVIGQCFALPYYPPQTS
jgi:hypothetical protein